ncbi:MAG: hypothetical protein EAX96_05295 [Candidatus Lokiarchaeota archaeon]|nr:hypothetical protein [Candidatus Lokiarchaeota archaeon]
MKINKITSFLLIFLLIFSFGLTFLTLFVDFSSLSSRIKNNGPINLNIKTNVPFIISNDNAFPTYANGTGNGSASNPWIIQNYYIDSVTDMDGILIENTAAYFIIQNCTILNRISGYSGIRLQTMSNGVVRNCTLNGNGDYGIRIRSSSYNNIIINNTMNNNYYGIYLSDSTNITLDSNYCEQNHDGIFVTTDAYYNHIQNNIIFNNTDDGIEVSSSSSHNIFANNNVSFNADEGINLDSGTNNTLISNIIHNNTDSGIYCSATGLDNTIRKNDIYHNDNAIYIYSSDNHNISENLIHDNSADGIYTYKTGWSIIKWNRFVNNTGYGINLQSSSPDNVIYLNEFIGNNVGGIQAYGDNLNNYWNYSTLGNYWSDYKSRYPGASLVNNVYWDTPFVLDEIIGSTDNHPLLDYFHNLTPSTPITIKNNAELADFASAGDGSSSDPYIIENYAINGSGLGENCITIYDTNLHFILRNCLLFNGTNGINVTEVYYGNIVNNIMYFHSEDGMYFLTCDYTIVENNIAYSNGDDGFELVDLDYGTCINNTANDNLDDGFRFGNPDHTMITNNTAYNNDDEGIQIEASHNSTTAHNTVINSTSIGIYLGDSYNCTVINNLAFGNGNGILVEFTNDTELINNTIYDSRWHGLVLDLLNDCNVTGNRIYDNLDYGVNLEASNNLTAINNTLFGNSRGFHIQGANYSIFLNNTVFDNRNYGFSTNYSKNNTYLDNKMWNNSNEIHFINLCLNNNITNNQIFQSSGFGINISQGNFNTIKQNTIENTTRGLSLDSSMNNTILSNFIKNSSLYGIDLTTNSQNNTVRNNTISGYNNTEDGIYVLESGNNTLYNNSIFNCSVYGVYLNKAVNNTINENEVAHIVDTGIYLNLSHECRVSNNTIYDCSSENYGGGFQFIASDNCRIINNTVFYNKYYGIYLYSSDNCKILNNTAHHNQKGIHAEIGNKLEIYENTLYNNDYFGIELIEVEYSAIHNNTASFSSSALIGRGSGIYLYLCHNNTLHNNTVFNNTGLANYGGIGIYINASYSNKLTSNTIFNNSGTELYAGIGILIYISNHNNCTDNRISHITGNTAGSGILILSACNNNTIYHNEIKNCKNQGIDLQNTGTNNNNTVYKNIIYEVNNGIRLEASDFTNITENEIFNTNMNGIYVFGSDNCTLHNNTIYNGTDGVVVWGSSENVTVTNNTIYNHSSQAVYLLCQKCKFYNNTVYENYDGFYLDTGADTNTFIHNTVFNNSRNGFTVSNANFNKIFFNNISKNKEAGILLYQANDNQIAFNYLNDNTEEGIVIEVSNNSVVYWNEILRNNMCIDEIDSVNNTMANNSCFEGLQLSTISPSIIIDGKIYLNWTKVSWATFYLVYQHDSPFIFFDLYKMAHIANVSSNHTTVQVSIIGTYYYGVLASNGTHMTSLSNIQAANVLGVIGPQLSPISPHNIMNGIIILNWSQVQWATYYLVYRDTSLFGYFDLPRMTFIENLTLNYITDQVFSIGTYYYGIVASNGTYSTSLSNIDNASVTGLSGTAFNITPFNNIPLFVPDNLNPSVFINISSNVSLQISITITLVTPGGLDVPNYGVIFIEILTNRTDYEVNATFRIYYNELNLPAGIEEDELDIYNWNGTHWVALGATLNATGNYLEYILTHFSYYAIIGEQADFGTPPRLPLEIIIIIIIIGAIAGISILSYVIVRKRRRSPGEERQRKTKLGDTQIETIEVDQVKILELQDAFKQPGLSLEEKLNMLISNEIPLNNVAALKDAELNNFLIQNFMILPNEFIEFLLKIDATVEEKLEIIEIFKNLPKEAQQDFLKELMDL